MDQRINLIDEMYESGLSRRLIVDCLCAGFYYGSFNRVGGVVENQNGQITEPDF